MSENDMVTREFRVRITQPQRHLRNYTPEQQAEGIAGGILDASGYPDGVTTTAKYIPPVEPDNFTATYIYFNRVGKFQAQVRGHFPNAAFVGYYRGAEVAREECLRLHAGHMPGLITSGSTYTVVVIPDDGLDVGWPVILPAAGTE